MSHFNKYNLNGNFTTSNGVALVAPTWEVSEFCFNGNIDKYQVVLHWIDANHDFQLLLDALFTTDPENLPTTESIENNIKSIPAFSNSTIVTP